MPDRTDINQLALAQNRAVELAQTDLSRLWANLEGLNPQTQRDLLLETVPALVERHGDIAATAAAEWYERVRLKDTGQARYEAVAADCFPSQAVQDSIRWKAGVLWSDPERMARFLMNATDRWVKYSGRATIMQNVSRDHARYAIVPQGKTCAWCTMLASRGFDYRSMDTARASMHEHCDCQPCPQWDAKKTIIAGYDPDAMFDQYTQAMKAVDKDRPAYLDNLHANGRETEILEVMRRQHPSEYTDGVHGYSPDRKDRSKQSVGDLNLATWADYRASLAERFIAANNPNWKLPPEQPTEVPRWWRDDPDLPELTVNHLNHLLYGSGEKARKGEGARKWRYSGGHMNGYGWISNRSEFPQDWDVTQILKSAKAVCKYGESGAKTKWLTIDGCDIIVAFGYKERIASVYPMGEGYERANHRY